MDWELILGIGRFVLATTLLLVLTVPTAFVIIQLELKIIAGLALRLGPNRVGPRGSLPEHDPRLQGAGQGGHRPRPGRPRHLHPRAVDGLHGRRDEHARHPVRARRDRGQLQHRHRLLLRRPGTVGRRPAGRRLGELQQVLAARRAAQRGADGQLRDPADAVDRRRGGAGRHAELQRADRVAAPARLAAVVAAGRPGDLLRRQPGRDQSHAVRHGRGRLRARGRAVHRVLRACASASSSSPSTWRCSS